MEETGDIFSIFVFLNLFRFLVSTDHLFCCRVVGNGAQQAIMWESRGNSHCVAFFFWLFFCTGIKYGSGATTPFARGGMGGGGFGIREEKSGGVERQMEMHMGSISHGMAQLCPSTWRRLVQLPRNLAFGHQKLNH